MNLFARAAEALCARTAGTGTEDGTVVISRNHDEPTCPFERGVPLEATFGGRTAQFVTGAPVEARVRVSMLFGAPLEGERERSAAGAVINAVAGFFGFARNVRSCNPDCRSQCLARFAAETACDRTFLVGASPVLERALAGRLVEEAERADLLVVLGHGLASGEGLACVEEACGCREVLMVGPSTAGTAALLELPHWCPYGR
ncbi:MAG: hypothetical protein GXY82_05570 [Methanospirillum sp.]|nr:hypothetical protein [Methanospirillum sp.]